MTAPVKIGFLGAGNIAGILAKTIARMDCVAPYCVAARELGRAQSFAATHGFSKACGSYEDMLADPAVELVYISTPISHHYEHIRLCLEQGKHVLCEKAFTINAAQAEEVTTLARSKGLLLAEAVWTRYLPFSATIAELAKSGLIGKVHSLSASLGYPVTHKPRMLDPALGGGALLDLSVYPLNFALMILGGDIEEITSGCVWAASGVDSQNSIFLHYRSGQAANLYATMLTQTDRRGVIYGDKGFLVVENINNPEWAQFYHTDWSPGERYKRPCQITGYEYEVEAAVAAIRQGVCECPQMPHRETVRVMELLDQIRAGWQPPEKGEEA